MGLSFLRIFCTAYNEGIKAIFLIFERESWRNETYIFVS